VRDRLGRRGQLADPFAHLVGAYDADAGVVDEVVYGA
jgi:hypothetical protein